MLILPKTVYDALPAAYVAAGVASAGLVGNTLAFVSGTLFALGGVLVYSLRLNYRYNEVARLNRLNDRLQKGTRYGV